MNAAMTANRGQGARGTRTAVFVAAFTALTVALVIGYRSWRGKADERSAAVGQAKPDEVARLRRELEQVRRDGTVTRQLMAAASAAAQVDETNRDVPAPPVVKVESAAQGPQSHEEFARLRAQELGHIESEFQKETRDPAWDPTRDLQSKLTRILPEGSAVDGLECRSSLCRMESSHQSLASYQAFTQSIVVSPGGEFVWNGPAVFEVTHEPEGEADRLRAVAYFARGTMPTLAAR
jgi:hypothetical protein